MLLLAAAVGLVGLAVLVLAVLRPLLTVEAQAQVQVQALVLALGLSLTATGLRYG